jgi:betaine reductase
MANPLRVVHYLNQFFGQMGGEEKAHLPCQVRLEPIGPGLALQQILGDRATIIATLICGDNFAAENLEDTARTVVERAANFSPDLFLAGPAFAAGRYGMACGAVCRAVSQKLRIPAVSGMSEENPAVAIYRSHVYIVPTGKSAARMREAISQMAQIALCLAEGRLPPAGSYFSQGIRELRIMEKTGAQRAVDMLCAYLSGTAVPTELPLPQFERVPPAPPIPDLRHTTIVLATEGGVIPHGNPDGIEMSMATKFGRYSIEGLAGMTPDRFTVAHGGYDNQYAKADPNRLVPLDVLRDLAAEGKIGAVGDFFYTTAGNATSVEHAARFGREIAQDIRQMYGDRVGVILTST